jgi:proteasome lid subunit RPN8/RPN11
MSPALLKIIQDYMVSQYPNEGCGFVVNGEFIPVENIAQDKKKDFLVSDEDFLKYSPVCSSFIHSHPDWYNCPTKLDMEQQQASGIPWGIVGTNKNAASGLQMFGAQLPIPDLRKRTFCHGVTDCCTLINDWGKINGKWSWTEVPRDWEWWQGSDDLYQENFARLGFKIVPMEDILAKGPQVGDIFLARIRSNKLNHAGVYIGDGLGLHHLTSQKPVDETRYPCEDPIMRWLKYIHLWARHENA